MVEICISKRKKGIIVEKTIVLPSCALSYYQVLQMSISDISQMLLIYPFKENWDNEQAFDIAKDRIVKEIIFLKHETSI